MVRFFFLLTVTVGRTDLNRLVKMHKQNDQPSANLLISILLSLRSMPIWRRLRGPSEHLLVIHS